MSGGFHPALNAGLNLLSACFMVAGFVFIKKQRIQAHKRAMLAAFGTSTVFLISYLIRYAISGTHHFQGPPGAKTVYLAILFSHMILAAVVPFMALRSIYLGLKDRRPDHRRIAKWTFPVWLYVSITGVAVYLMLYVLFGAS